jgi:hypothetical protein
MSFSIKEFFVGIGRQGIDQLFIAIPRFIDVSRFVSGVVLGDYVIKQN